jgi:hypothetical protein
MTIRLHNDGICAKVLGPRQQRLSNVLSTRWHGFRGDPMAVQYFSHSVPGKGLQSLFLDGSTRTYRTSPADMRNDNAS